MLVYCVNNNPIKFVIKWVTSVLRQLKRINKWYINCATMFGCALRLAPVAGCNAMKLLQFCVGLVGEKMFKFGCKLEFVMQSGWRLLKAINKRASLVGIKGKVGHRFCVFRVNKLPKLTQFVFKTLARLFSLRDVFVVSHHLEMAIGGSASAVTLLYVTLRFCCGGRWK